MTTSAPLQNRYPVLALPEQWELLRLFRYDPVTGVVTRKVRTSNCVYVGDAVGTICDGHLKTHVNGREYYLHRLIWKMVTGCDPVGEIDHENGLRPDNRWTNLREATDRQQMGNTKLHRHNTSGVRGVYWDRAKQKWAAKISIGNRSVPLGRYHDIDQAKAAYQRAAEQHFGAEFVAQRAH